MFFVCFCVCIHGSQADPFCGFAVCRCHYNCCPVVVYLGIAVHVLDRDGATLYSVQGRVCRPLFVVENNRLRIRKKHINDLHDPNYGWTNLMQQVGRWVGWWVSE